VREGGFLMLRVSETRAAMARLGWTECKRGRDGSHVCNNEGRGDCERVGRKEISTKWGGRIGILATISDAASAPGNREKNNYRKNRLVKPSMSGSVADQGGEKVRRKARKDLPR